MKKLFFGLSLLIISCTDNTAIKENEKFIQNIHLLETGQTFNSVKLKLGKPETSSISTIEGIKTSTYVFIGQSPDYCGCGSSPRAVVSFINDSLTEVQYDGH